MNDYISRQDAIELIRNDGLELVYYGKEEAIKCLESVPVADVKPVVYGEWDFNDCCTNCGEEADYNWKRGIYFYSDFCPNCGADMRGKKGKKDE